MRKDKSEIGSSGMANSIIVVHFQLCTISNNVLRQRANGLVAQNQSRCKTEALEAAIGILQFGAIMQQKHPIRLLLQNVHKETGLLA